MTNWQEAPEPPFHVGPLGMLRGLGRGAAMGLVTYGCLILLLLARLIEAPLFGAARPITPWITQFVCRTSCAILGLRLQITGTPMTGKPRL